MRKASIALLILVAVCALPLVALADSSYQTLPFSQNWTNTGLISTTNSWTGVPGIRGQIGDWDATNTTGADPQTLLSDPLGATVTDVVFANQTDPSTFTSGGPAEFETLANPTVAMQGSGTGDAPFLVIYLNTTGKQNITVAYNLRDIDCATNTNNGTFKGQQVALQYRAGTQSGSFINVPAAYVAAAQGAVGTCTKVTPVSVVLPSACDNVATLQLRIMTTNAPGTDDETGVDDISITGSDIPPPTGACCVRYSTPGACVITTQVACLAIPGIYLGDGVPCDAGICATPTTRTTWGKVKTIYR